jgi:hypothetical protein
MKILESLKGLVQDFLWKDKVAEIKKLRQDLAEIKKVSEDFRAIVLSVISQALVIIEEQFYHTEKNDEWRKVQELRRKIEMERK